MSDAERRVRAEWPDAVIDHIPSTTAPLWVVRPRHGDRACGWASTAEEAWDDAASRLPRNTDADRLAEALALLEKCRPIVEADAQMQDDICGMGVMEYGSEAEASVARAANAGWGLVGQIDAVLGKEDGR